MAESVKGVTFNLKCDSQEDKFQGFQRFISNVCGYRLVGISGMITFGGGMAGM